MARKKGLLYRFIRGLLLLALVFAVASLAYIWKHRCLALCVSFHSARYGCARASRGTAARPYWFLAKPMAIGTGTVLPAVLKLLAR